MTSRRARRDPCATDMRGLHGAIQTAPEQRHGHRRRRRDALNLHQLAINLDQILGDEAGEGRE